MNRSPDVPFGGLNVLMGDGSVRFLPNNDERNNAASGGEGNQTFRRPAAAGGGGPDPWDQVLCRQRPSTQGLTVADATVQSGPNLHGEQPDSAPVVLLLIDVINDFDFFESAQLLRHAIPMARRIADLTRRARAAGVPVIYVNDNFGRWRSDFRSTVEHCQHSCSAGREIAALLHPEPEDYFVLKPRHSGFYSTTLDVLLRDLRTEALVLTGVAGDICVLFTANDAYMRGFRIFVPEDCIASNTEEKNRGALAQMRTALKADIRPSTELAWDAIMSPLSSRGVSSSSENAARDLRTVE